MELRGASIAGIPPGRPKTTRFGDPGTAARTARCSSGADRALVGQALAQRKTKFTSSGHMLSSVIGLRSVGLTHQPQKTRAIIVTIP